VNKDQLRLIETTESLTLYRAVPSFDVVSVIRQLYWELVTTLKNRSTMAKKIFNNDEIEMYGSDSDLKLMAARKPFLICVRLSARYMNAPDKVYSLKQ
jgi:hypothetical protein